ncbi:MAG: carbohydrate-binding protein, partial [Chitinophagaceae bacterium]|nr:carbohydrate-binding protein [Chitinophagaceae bacterium]
DYFNGKLLFYEWIRGWMKMVSMDAEGNYQQMEPFMDATKFKSPIDVEVGPDGRFYVLEYGSGWFSKNADAALSRIDYNGGNRAPKAKINVPKLSGSIPFTVKADAIGSADADNDALSYVWHFGSAVRPPANTPNTSFTFTKAGEYAIYVEVKDPKGGVTRSEVVKVYAGNEAPEVSVTLDAGNKFYFPGQPVPYTVNVKDKEDGTTDKVDKKSIYVKVDYLNGPDKAQVVGHQVMTSIMEGKNLAATLDCKACHKEAEKSVGPAYKMVAEKYEGDAKARAYLTNKIIKGGSGVWGEVAMAAHPDLKQEEAGMIVDWVLSLNKKDAPSLPSKGTIKPSEKDMGTGNLMLITATYTDKGGAGIKPLSAMGSVSLKSALVNMPSNSGNLRVEIKDWNKHRAAFLNISQGNNGWLEFSNIDLESIGTIEFGYGIPAQLIKGYQISLHQDSPNGPKIASFKLENHSSTMFSTKELQLQNVVPGERKLYMKVERMDTKETNRLAIISMKLVPKK